MIKKFLKYKYFFFIVMFLCAFLFLQRQSSYHQYFYKVSFKTSYLIKSKIFEIKKFLKLKDENKNLLEENSKLKEENLNLKINLKYKNIFHDYSLTYSNVVWSSDNFFHNFLLLDKGEKDGISKGMAVISEKSIVGVVIDTSENFSFVCSIFNSNLWISAKIKNKNFVGSVHWNDLKEKKILNLCFISKLLNVEEGDIVETSGYSDSFPPGLYIGEISSIKKINKPFYEIEIKVNEDFSSINHVYLVKYKKQEEKEKILKKNNILNVN